jgi:hypothetical protein
MPPRAKMTNGNAAAMPDPPTLSANLAKAKLVEAQFVHLRHFLKKKLPFGNLRRLSRNFILDPPNECLLIEEIDRKGAVDDDMVLAFIRHFLLTEIARAYEYFDGRREFSEEKAKASRQLDFILQSDKVKVIVREIARIDWVLADDTLPGACREHAGHPTGRPEAGEWRAGGRSR